MTPQDQQPGQLQQASAVEPVREQDKIHLILAYLSCLALIPYLSVKDSDFVRWHAKQGVVLFGVEAGLSVLGMLLWQISCVFFLVNLGLFAVSILAIVKALRGERWRLPVVSDLADKLPNV